MSGRDDFSGDEEAAAEAVSYCASCGIPEVDSVKLQPCDGCDLVRYCSDDCQKDHWPEHEAKCKERTAELRDEILFRQPESTHLGNCPICCLPFSLQFDQRSITVYPCCCKSICNGCSFANDIRRIAENKDPSCPFCRQPLLDTERVEKSFTKRVEANDPGALVELGMRASNNGDYDSAFKYWTKAAELGDADAHCKLSILYRYDEGLSIEKDEKKEVYHLEEAAIGGHPYARINLGVYEERDGRIDRAVKHLIIAAKLGWDGAIQRLKECYKDGHMSKEDFAAALRSHHAAIVATKSPQREAAAKAKATGEIEWA